LEEQMQHQSVSISPSEESEEEEEELDEVGDFLPNNDHIQNLK